MGEVYGEHHHLVSLKAAAISAGIQYPSVCYYATSYLADLSNPEDLGDGSNMAGGTSWIQSNNLTATTAIR